MTTQIITPTDSPDNLKRCTKCGEWKSFDGFHRNANAKDGLARWCKTCACANTRAYQLTDAGKMSRRASNHNRRARKQITGGTRTAADDLSAIRAAQTDKKGRLICWRCNKPIKETPHLDHWIPLDKGGSNDPGNLHYMHATCNLTKSAKHPFELGVLL
jgi:hypothetical protein